MVNTRVIVMDGRDNKESSNLLQNSENLSLSDLELPEIEHQRKRKVRRKTRPRLTTTRQRTEFPPSGQRKIILIGAVFFVSSCWLLILSYTVSVIHIENQRLQIEIKKVSVISKNIPEEMQNWHEKSSLLERNQSIIFEKLNEIQVAIEILRNNLTLYVARVDVQTEYSKNDKFVADLGAKLEAVSSDMEVIKDHFAVLQKNYSRLQEDFDKLRVRIREISYNFPEKNKDDEVCSQQIQNITTNFENELKTATSKITFVNDTLTQKVNMLSEELIAHQTKFYDLLDKSANITSHVSSIKNDWSKYRQQFMDCEAKLKNVENNIFEVMNKTSYFQKSLEELRWNCTANSELVQTNQNHGEGAKNNSIQGPN